MDVEHNDMDQGVLAEESFQTGPQNISQHVENPPLLVILQIHCNSICNKIIKHIIFYFPFRLKKSQSILKNVPKSSTCNECIM